MSFAGEHLRLNPVLLAFSWADSFQAFQAHKLYCRRHKSVHSTKYIPCCLQSLSRIDSAKVYTACIFSESSTSSRCRVRRELFILSKHAYGIQTRTTYSQIDSQSSAASNRSQFVLPPHEQFVSDPSRTSHLRQISVRQSECFVSCGSRSGSSTTNHNTAAAAAIKTTTTTWIRPNWKWSNCVRNSPSEVSTRKASKRCSSSDCWPPSKPTAMRWSEVRHYFREIGFAFFSDGDGVGEGSRTFGGPTFVQWMRKKIAAILDDLKIVYSGVCWSAEEMCGKRRENGNGSGTEREWEWFLCCGFEAVLLWTAIFWTSQNYK